MNTKYFRPNSKQKAKGILSYKQLERIKLQFSTMKVKKNNGIILKYILKFNQHL